MNQITRQLIRCARPRNLADQLCNIAIEITVLMADLENEWSSTLLNRPIYFSGPSPTHYL